MERDANVKCIRKAMVAIWSGKLVTETGLIKMPRYKIYDSHGKYWRTATLSEAEVAKVKKYKQYKYITFVKQNEVKKKPKRSNLPFGGPSNKMWKPTMRW